MNANSGNESSGNFIWGVIAGLVAVLGAGGLYLSGVFTNAPEPDANTPQETASVPAISEPADEAPKAAKEADEVTVAEPSNPDTASSEETPAPAEDLAEQAEEPAETEAAEVAEEVAAPAPAPVAPPVLDQIFVETDGTALLSGDAEPGSQIEVLLNGEVAHSFTVDGSGQFAEFVTIPFSDTAQGLVLQSTDGAQATRSDDYLIAALPKPIKEEPVAETTPEAQQSASEDAQEQVATVDETQPDADAAADVSEPETSEPGAATVETAELTDEAPQQDQQVAVLRSGEEGVELVQPPVVRDTPPEQVALDTIGYSETGDVQLTGRVQDGTAIRLYLNNRLVADLAPEQDGSWRSDLEGIDPGVYTLRVDAVNTDGTVLSRVETPFKREPLDVLQAATGTAQADTPQATPAIRSVTVQQGDTLWAISRDRFGDGVLYVRLFEANRDLIRDPDLIYPGQIFTIPE
ncbi:MULTISPECIES: LysM peptidoglycan-binding domain-containing protein [unclassified Ruegeria]|uniref:LysM peptidoglycan-binding domain-containing protein n=1 Tax=unclassified Ruegeria TaxID=2625375 RepID=UPI0014880890|nr:MULTISPECIES: LysM peptidoglycan-binding domain-containing protein [unclassified Ruegeria]NOD77386.1 LysM peptidoglycan-binding domain-containing protein [Ruegeria sp. HKCCD4332]NOD87809.1 LysM peptidoglycan-binding domain-containing protein [Ruegeria sp. HKCCD4318]NOE14179.1 LysM peptidoglycan-binding domain-containing protein [Ruegeria sp. HKCCD4318-2]NOG08464.1 LysM peptidoglycan-binding domain-containing protein [Ruegeria sp. HKCCD4315]